MKIVKVLLTVLFIFWIGTCFYDAATQHPVFLGNGYIAEKWNYQSDRDLYDFVTGINKSGNKYTVVWTDSLGKSWQVEAQERFYPALRGMKVNDKIKYYVNIGDFYKGKRIIYGHEIEKF